MEKGTTATKVAPTARTAEYSSSSEPIWKGQEGRVQGAMWRHEQEDEKTKKVRIRYTIAISRSYKDKEGDWQSVHYFDLDDLKNVHRIAEAANEEVERLRHIEE